MFPSTNSRQVSKVVGMWEELALGETPVSEGAQEDPSEKPIGLPSPGTCGGWRNLLCRSRNQVWRTPVCRKGDPTWSPQCSNGLVQCTPTFAPHSGPSKSGSLLFSPYDIFPIIFFKKIMLKHISLETRCQLAIILQVTWQN